MTKADPTKSPGYRKSLPTREDRLAKPWLIAVGIAFVLVLLLSALGVPSRFTPDPTPIPLPSIIAPSGSASPSESASPSASSSPSAGESGSPEPSPTD